MTVKDEIGRGAGTIVYRALWRGRTVALKVPAQDYGREPEWDAWFRREGALLACIDHPGVAQVLEVGEVQGRPYLVREYVAGRTLAHHLQSGPLPAGQVKNLAVSLAGALGEVHRRGLVHRDIKPLNIILADTGEPMLIDFGLATRFQLDDASQAVGTLLYSSPEQSRMLKRPVDGRSDLYSLGVVLFECAVGSPPFGSDDVGELLRQHAVAPAPDPRSLNPGLEPELAAIISRLLAKDPDDRYQSAADLLGALGAPVQASLERPLVGRQAELQALLAGWQETQSGQGTVVLVSGPAGCGKSRLVREFLALAQPEVLQAKCEEGDPIPLRPLIAAIDDYLARTAGDLSPARNAAEEAGPMVGRFSARLAELVPEETRHAQPDRFYQAPVDWLLSLARLVGGAVLFLDDLQWIDRATQSVLRRLDEAARGAPLMVVVTCRDQAEPELSGELHNPLLVKLTPLPDEQLERLVSAQLGGRELAPAVMKKLIARSAGNPYFLEEYLRSLLDAGVLLPSGPSWRLESGGLENLELGGDALALLRQRTQELGEAEQVEVLQTAALAGNRFELGFLEALHPGRVVGAIDRASELHLVELGADGSYHFVHDRVREALLETLDSPTAAEIHRRLADFLETTQGSIYARARHCSLGYSGERVFSTCFRAGQQALENFAFEEAYKFFSQALEAAPETACWELFDGLGRACLHLNRVEEGAGYIERALHSCPQPVERADLCGLLAQAHLSEFDARRSRQALERGLRELGYSPPRPALRAAKVGLRLATFMLGHRWGWLPRESRPARRQQLGALCRLYQRYAMQQWFEMDYVGMLDVATRAMTCALRLGDSREMVRSHCQLAYLMGLLGNPRGIKVSITRAEELSLALEDTVSLTHTQLFEALALQLVGDARESEVRLAHLLETRARWLSAADHAVGCTDLIWNLLSRGRAESALHWLDYLFRHQRVSSQPFNEMEGLVLHQYSMAALALKGRQREAADCGRLVLDRFPEPNHIRHLGANYYGYLILVQTEQGELGEPLEEALRAFDSLGISPAFTALQRLHGFLFKAYAWLARCQRAERPAPLLPHFDQARRQLARASRIPQLSVHCLILAAARRRLGGDAGKALDSLGRADGLSARSDNPWATYELALERARCLRALGREEMATSYAHQAFAIARSEGWLPRMRRVREAFRLDRVSSQPSGKTDRASRSRQLDLLLNLGLASRTVFEPRHQARVVLDELIKLLGAERGFLFLEPEGDRHTLLAGRDAEGRNLGEDQDYSRTVLAEVAVSRAPVIVACDQDGRAIGSDSIRARGLRSVLAVGLEVGDELRGVVYLDSRLARGIFDDSDLQIVRALSNHIAVAIEHARATQVELRYQAERRQRDLAEGLRDLMRELASTLDSREVLERLLERLDDLLPSRSAAATLFATGQTVARGFAGEPSPPEQSKPEEGRLVCPLMQGEEQLGAVWLEDPGGFGPREVELLATFAGQAVVALRNAELFAEVRRRATTDELTGLANRPHFFELAEKELQRARRSGAGLWVVMMDVDHFKRFNDTYGHAVGDHVLAHVADLCRQSLREVDLIGRYGGEEFAMVFPDTGVEARVVAERLRETIAGTPLLTEGQALTVTVSLGLSRWSPEEPALEAVLKRADAALYQAKAEGRNRVVVG